jgi:hypothetical protein
MPVEVAMLGPESFLLDLCESLWREKEDASWGSPMQLMR